MSAMMLELASDWTGQLNEERLVLCAEALFIHQLIGAPAHQHIIANIRTRAEAQREIRARRREKELENVCQPPVQIQGA